MPSDFHFNEVVILVGYYGYFEIKTGKTSGSRIKFMDKEENQIKFHKPHPTGIMKRYQLREIKEKLGL